MNEKEPLKTFFVLTAVVVVFAVLRTLFYYFILIFLERCWIDAFFLLFDSFVFLSHRRYVNFKLVLDKMRVSTL